MKITEPVLGAPCWAELGTPDVADAGRFYGGLFGWTPEEDASPEAGGYTMMLLDDDPVAAATPLYQTDQPVAWTMAVSVADADVVAERVRETGGAVLMEPMDVFDLGRFAVVADPGGAVFTLWQAGLFRGAARLDERGALCWVELATRDTVAARAFYTTALGWTATGGDAAGDAEGSNGGGPYGGYTQWGIGGRDFGGMVRMTDDRFPPGVPPHWLLYFAVDDVDASVAHALELGGGTTFPAVDVPGTGRVAGLTDPQGGAFALYTPESYRSAGRAASRGLTADGS
ncbi:VOC family protein [Streptomyces sp. DSM 42041]|uniref:VOC family protein n=1 Tax=Streptomyces hazeniae TaxID=3075538 RepID=A0ABU2NSG7_9ACTN|nr:VOC family protein [Streptomyces sp. DSM 42041]MDT0379931.1 VOC family protein [Streptomyces sp. DSM 42041]